MKKVLIAMMVVALAASMLFAQGANEASGAAAVKYPNGDVNFIIPNAAGGGNDLTVRAMIPVLQKVWGVNVVPLNQKESGGAVAANNIMTGKADGQTFYFNSQSLILMKYGKMPNIDLSKFQAVAQVVQDTGNIYVKADSPYKTVEDLFAAMKAGKLKMAHNGKGALWHLAGIRVSNLVGADTQFVAYTGGGSPMLTALAAGEVDWAIENVAGGKAMVDSGLIRPLATLGEERVSAYDIPTLKELGYDLVFPVWRGVFTTKGVDEATLAEIDKAFKAVVESDEFKKYCETNSFPIKYRNHSEFQAFYEEEIKVYDELMKNI